MFIWEWFFEEIKWGLENLFFFTFLVYGTIYYYLSFLIFKDNRIYILNSKDKYWYVKYIYYVFCFFLALILDYYLSLIIGFTLYTFGLIFAFILKIYLILFSNPDGNEGNRWDYFP